MRGMRKHSLLLVGVAAWIGMAGAVQGALVEAEGGEAIGKVLKAEGGGPAAGEQGFGGTGSGQWRYAVGGEKTWADYAVECTLRLVKPASKRDMTESCAFATYHALGKLGGYEAAVVVRHESPQKHYRVAVSTMWKEILLWRPTGGIVQVAEFPFELGADYKLNVACRGRRITVAVDGKTLIDWWDTADPVAAGQVGLGLKEGEAYFMSLKVSALARQTQPAPAHKPQLRQTQWHGQPWFFDGAEPICHYRKNVNSLDHMKFLPGYRGLMHTTNAIMDKKRFYPKKVIESKVTGGGASITMDTVAVDPKTGSAITCATHLVIGFDAKTGLYTYDQDCAVDVPSDETGKVARRWDHGDPCVLGAVGRATTQDPKAFKAFWKWGVIQNAEGNVYKVPFNHNGHFLAKGASGSFINPKGGKWLIVGDSVVCPFVQVRGMQGAYDGTVHVEHCWWAYDMHTRFSPTRDETGQIAAGRYVSKVSYGALRKVDADKLLAAATFENPVDIDAKAVLFTAGLGYAERFDKEVLLATPHAEHQIKFAVLDRTVGFDDKVSLRLDPFCESWMLTGSSYFMPAYGKRNRISFQVKTRDVTGDGPTIGFGRMDKPIGVFYPTGVTGTKDWTKVEFVTHEPIKGWGVYLFFRNSGGGTVWIDNFKMEALGKDATTDAPAGRPYPLDPKDKDVVLRWTADGAAGGVMDASGYGHHGRCFGNVQRVTDGKRQVLELDGKSHIWPLQTANLTLKPPYTMVYDLKPESEGMLFYAGFQYGIRLEGKGPKMVLQYRNAGGKPFNSKAFVQKGVWQRLVIVAEADQVKLYRDGELVEALAEKPRALNWMLFAGSSWHRHVSLFGTGAGAMARIYRDPPNLCLKGRVAGVTFYSRALTEDEIRTMGGSDK